MTTKEAIEVFNNPTQHWPHEREQAITLAIAALENAVNCEELIDQIEGTTWYHIENGVLVEGTTSDGGTLLYKVEDILRIVEPYADIEDELYGKPNSWRTTNENNHQETGT